MPRYLIHIGRHKTGTSSLQKFLFQNMTGLHAQGMFYPHAGLQGIAHHALAKCFPRSGRLVQKAEDQASIRGLMGDLRKEVSGFDGRVLLSSEAFQNVIPSALAERFAPHRTTVIVYLREQLSYIISSYQQKVQATGHIGTVSDFAARTRLDYCRFMHEWQTVFGKENLLVRPYNRQFLFSGDVIPDFCQILSINAELLEPFKDDQNPSIGGAILELKRIVNLANPAFNQTTHAYKAFSQVAGAHSHYRIKPLLPHELDAELIRSFSASNRKLFEDYFGGKDVFEHVRRSSRPGRCVTAAELSKSLQDVSAQDKSVGVMAGKTLHLLWIHLRREGTLSGFFPIEVGDDRMKTVTDAVDDAAFDDILQALGPAGCNQFNFD